MIGYEHDYQRQIDRACAAQSPDLLPSLVSGQKLNAAKERIKKQKQQYEKPANDF